VSKFHHEIAITHPIIGVFKVGKLAIWKLGFGGFSFAIMIIKAEVWSYSPAGKVPNFCSHLLQNVSQSVQPSTLFATSPVVISRRILHNRFILSR
jgi:hypothetical protein